MLAEMPPTSQLTDGCSSGDARDDETCTPARRLHYGHVTGLHVHMQVQTLL